MVIRIILDIFDTNFNKSIFEEDLYLNNTAHLNSKRNLSYSTFFSLDNIEASTFNYNGKAYEETIVSNFNEKNNLEDSFYDDSVY